ncbi:hypothetical protein ElyMa_003317700 [Elysia marginata]|uniref:Uncharacterized protein n=1 Tax=Elysia marginata TaxID=1093978 RepID=A0AAV4JFH7_9GAST|nr:hypothetical protein ElyMa_003317700 [Elysia marginata]
MSRLARILSVRFFLCPNKVTIHSQTTRWGYDTPCCPVLIDTQKDILDLVHGFLCQWSSPGENNRDSSYFLLLWNGTELLSRVS